MRLSSVLLPQPDGPTTEANSPGASCERDSVERDDAAIFERLRDVLDDDVDAAVRSLAHCGFTRRFRIFVYVLPPIFALTVQRSVSPPSGVASRASGGKIM